MIPVIAFLLVSGCLCAPSGNTTSTTSSGSSSSGSSSSSVSSSSTDGNGVVYSITKFSSSSGVPNITTSLGNVAVTQTSVPLFGSSMFSSASQTSAAIRNQTNQAIAAMHKQNQAHFSSINNSIQQAVKTSHTAFQNSMKTMFRPLSIFTSSPFFV